MTDTTRLTDADRIYCNLLEARMARLEAQVGYLLGVVADITRSGNAGPSPFLTLLPADDDSA